VLALAVAACSSTETPARRPDRPTTRAPDAAAARTQDPATARGRVPAPPMGFGGADWLTRPEREREEQPEKMLDLLGLRTGQTVADIGAGVGFHTVRLARRVGPTGRVYATDMQPEMIAALERAIAAAGLSNVTPVLTDGTSTGLPPGAIDVALMVDVYHELAAPEAFLAALAPAFAPGGRLVLVEFRGEDPDVPIRAEHKMTAAQVIRELDAAGYGLVERQDALPWQHFLAFRPRP
jgi:predicted methyltransferase